MQNSTLEIIENHPVMLQVLNDSYGGIIYNVAYRGTYDETGTLELIALWDSMSDSEQSSANGITKGAINFIKGN